MGAYGKVNSDITELQFLPLSAFIIMSLNITSSTRWNSIALVLNFFFGGGGADWNRMAKIAEKSDENTTSLDTCMDSFGEGSREIPDPYMSHEKSCPWRELLIYARWLLLAAESRVPGECLRSYASSCTIYPSHRPCLFSTWKARRHLTSLIPSVPENFREQIYPASYQRAVSTDEL